jgi:phospholipid/cholesterol/gamma-HCH transport system permease protein
MSAEPTFATEVKGDTLLVSFFGDWTITQPKTESQARALSSKAANTATATFDLSEVAAIDTAGAWLIDRCRVEINQRGGQATFAHASDEHSILLKEAHWRKFEQAPIKHGSSLIGMLADIGQTLTSIFQDFAYGFAFLGEVVASLIRLLLHPMRFRFTSFVYHMEGFGFRSLPIIVTINFLVGCIVAQQGLFQLTRFGAATFAVDLIGILVLRELAVLLTSIMIAGRSGSAITAEIGSMKMREEIDALRVMGLDPIEVLIIPRLLALLVSLPLLTFLADMAALFGGLVTAWTYGGIGPEIFMARLKDAIGFNTMMVGLIKAPFMALVISIVSAMEGMAVEGSAESLGGQVTASVVKSIFMVIFVDGLFAMFFAAIDY